ncbi:hypothetical protein MHYP_G00192410 [Metynnis hypsauchen]
MERESRKRARREIEWVRTVEASAAQDSQLSNRRSRPHTHSGGRQTEGEGSGAFPFRSPHWPIEASSSNQMQCTGGKRLRRRTTRRSWGKLGQSIAVRFQLDSPATSVDSQRGLSLAT